MKAEVDFNGLDMALNNSVSSFHLASNEEDIVSCKDKTQKSTVSQPLSQDESKKHPLVIQPSHVEEVIKVKNCLNRKDVVIKR